MSRLVFILLLLPCLAPAQRNLSFNRIGTEDAMGLASNTVYCTHQDRTGYLWVGTSNGLQRFDGTRFRHFGRSRPAPQELPVASVMQIVPHSEEELWITLPNERRFGRFHTKTFRFTEASIRPKKPLPGNAVFRLHKDRLGNVLLFVWKYGVLRYNAGRNAFEDDNVLTLPAGWIPSLYFFEDTVKRQLWLPCPDSGLAVYDYPSGQLFTSRYNPQQIPLLASADAGPGVWETFIDRKRRHWLFSWRPIHHYRCYDAAGNSLTDTAGLNDHSQYNELRYFYQSRGTGLWFYGQNCLYNDDETGSPIRLYHEAATRLSGMRYKDVHHIAEDRDGITWISTDNGLFYVSGSSGKGVANMHVGNEKSGIEITDLIQLKGNQYWLSTWGKGVITLTGEFRPYDAAIYQNQPLFDEVTRTQYRQVWTMFQDVNGKVWIGCQAGRYMLYDTLTRQTQFLALPDNLRSTIRYIVQDRSGHVWFGTQRGDVLRFNGQRFERKQQFGTVIRRLLVDNTGWIWGATEGQGVFCLDTGGRLLRHFTTKSPQPLFTNIAFDLEQLNDSTIVCAAGALNFINKKTGTVQWVTYESGLPGNSAQLIRRDAKGYLWVNTRDGLCRYNPANRTVTLYGKKDGMEYERFATAADYLCNEGFLMFTGNRHLLFFKPELFEISTTPPDVVLTDLKLFSQSLPLDSLRGAGASFAYNKNSLTFDFSALSFLQRDKLVYYYRLVGSNEGWVRTDRQPSVSYSLLPPGRYRFEVFAENIDGTRSASVTGFSFRIRPPFWQTWWFIGLGVAAIAGLAYYLHRQRINKLLAVEAVRSRVARDLHDDVGSTLSTINILGSMAKTRLHSDTIKTSEYISKITENSQRMMEAMDDIVWSIKPSNDTMEKILVRMKEFALSVLEAKDIAVDLVVDPNVASVRLSMEARRDLFLIFKEAVNNAAKYSKAENVRIRIACRQRRLIVSVEDDGVGFDPAMADGNGLGNMQKRAEMLRGRLQVISRKGEGTAVTLNIPVGA